MASVAARRFRLPDDDPGAVFRLEVQCVFFQPLDCTPLLAGRRAACCLSLPNPYYCAPTPLPPPPTPPANSGPFAAWIHLPAVTYLPPGSICSHVLSMFCPLSFGCAGEEGESELESDPEFVDLAAGTGRGATSGYSSSESDDFIVFEGIPGMASCATVVLERRV